LYKKSKSIIKAFRSLQGISQIELAAKLGCSQSRISKVESGIISLPKKDVPKIAEVLGVNPDLLSGDSDD